MTSTTIVNSAASLVGSTMRKNFTSPTARGVSTASGSKASECQTTGAGIDTLTYEQQYNDIVYLVSQPREFGAGVRFPKEKIAGTLHGPRVTQTMQFLKSCLTSQGLVLGVDFKFDKDQYGYHVVRFSSEHEAAKSMLALMWSENDRLHRRY